MNLRIVSEDRILIQAITQGLPGIPIIVLSDAEGLKDVSEDVLLIDTALIGTDIKVDHGKAVYLTKDSMDIPDTDAQVIRYDGRAQPVVDALRELLMSGMVHKNVIACWGPISGTGTTTVAMFLFQSIPENYRILFLSLTDVPGIEYIPQKVEGSISQLLPRLIARTLDMQDIPQSATVIGSHHYLAGLQSVVDVPAYTVEDTAHLIGLAAKYYDYVIIDAGYGPSLLGIAALTSSSRVYIITDPTAIAAIRYEQVSRQLFDQIPAMDRNRWRLVVNKDDRDSLFQGGLDYGIRQAAALRAVPYATAIRAGYDPALITDLDSGFRSDMGVLIREMHADAGILAPENPGRKKRWRE